MLKLYVNSASSLTAISCTCDIVIGMNVRVGCRRSNAIVLEVTYVREILCMYSELFAFGRYLGKSVGFSISIKCTISLCGSVLRHRMHASCC